MRAARAFRRFAPALMAAAALGASPAAHAQWAPPAPEAIVELPSPMPAAPRIADLVEFEVTAARAHRFGVDPKSFRPEGVRYLRLTMVVISSGGTLNVSYEAIDCETGMHRLLALGHADGSWHPVANAQWSSVRGEDRALRQHQVVFNAACKGSSLVGDTAHIVRRLTGPLDDRYLR